MWDILVGFTLTPLLLLNPLTMALSNIVTFCFPAPSSEDLFPDDNYNQNRRRADDLDDANGNGDGGTPRRPALSPNPNSRSYRFARPEQDDLSKGVLPLTLGHAVRHYLADWVLAAVLW
jgi:diacylglycerol diphosphate phosphatase/phosphatidate phosphatase